MRRNQNEPNDDPRIIAMPLTLEELSVVDSALSTACESEDTDAADKQMIGLIKERILRFAERQGAWWDLPNGGGLWMHEPIRGVHGKGEGATSKQGEKWLKFWKKK